MVTRTAANRARVKFSVPPGRQNTSMASGRTASFGMPV